MALHETRPVERAEGASSDEVAVEEPLEIRVEGEPLAVVMRTPGHDEELVVGFLRSEGVLETASDLTAVATIAANVVDVRLAAGVEAHRDGLLRATRAIQGTSACGICGRASLDQVQMAATGPLRLEPLAIDALEGLADLLRAHQPGFAATGGLHGAALVAQGVLRIAREDVGRHNAVDKVLGWELLHGEPGGILVVSSRAGFEIVQKALLARIGTVVALGAATTLAVDLARDSGMVLYGFVGRGRYNRYT